MNLVLGIDTSCYTTSVALLDEKGLLVADERRSLAVKQGGRGLSQSEMVYQHTRQLPEVFAAAAAKTGGPLSLVAVAASTRPRPVPESYMPAFLVGSGYARVLAASHGVPFKPLSHQENHILAGIWSAGGPAAASFLALHASGGTTELTLVRKNAPGFSVQIIGGSDDIAAGQFIDRIGVALGLPFPAGPHLEALAGESDGLSVRLPVAVSGCRVSFAGPESQARRLLAKGASPAALAAGVQTCLAQSLTQILAAAVRSTGINDILLVGGVMANDFLRRRIAAELGDDAGVRLYAPQPRYSGDNAVGAACFALT